MTLSSLSYEQHDGIGVVTFTTPQRLNAITEARLQDLDAVLTQAEADAGLRALVLYGGSGTSFCVGLDLDLLERAFADLDYFETVVRRLGRLVARLEALPVPTFAALNGVARAGGLELALGCDFLLIAEEARIGDVHTDAGVLPATCSLRLARRVGTARAKEIIWTARWLSAADAVAIGLALRALPRAGLLEGTLALARQMTDKPRACIATNKAVFQRGADAGVAEGVELELQQFMHYMRNEPWGREGYRAFREGRPPSWRRAG